MKNDKDILVEVEGLSKKFCKDLKTSLWYGVKDLTANVFGKKQTSELREKEFWAVKDISFTLRRGECLGLIGHNGAGKSTLLKILNGLINLDEGKVTIRGKVGALIELGAGFNPILSGIENIYNNGAILGFTKAEIDTKVEEIIDFSEIREFIDMPVQNYSSGMKVRLGFAVAAQMEPDVLIIDEVLAVGDLGFRIKCMNKIQKLLKNSAVIFVSHSMPQVTMVSTEYILLENGIVDSKGKDVGGGVEKYFSKFASNNKQILSSKNVTLKKIKLTSKTNKYVDNQLIINSGEYVSVTGELIFTSEIRKVKIRIGIFNIEYRIVAEVDSDQTLEYFEPKDGQLQFNVIIQNLNLRVGKYTLHVHVTDYNTNEKILRYSDAASFIVKNTLTIGADFLLPSQWKLINSN
jgi:homopolymeric O-antigen transport system ATP-binding protein